MDKQTLVEMVMKVKNALSRTQNRSAFRAGKISCTFIKRMTDTVLKKRLLEEAARSLITGIMLSEQ